MANLLVARSAAALPFAGFDQLANLSLDQITLESADVADVELAVEMIGFMQKSPGQQFVAGLLKNLTV